MDDEAGGDWYPSSAAAHSASRRVLLRSVGAAWPSLALYLGMWPSALAGEWTAVWLFFFSGTVLAVTLSRAHYLRARARGPGAPAKGAEQ